MPNPYEAIFGASQGENEPETGSIEPQNPYSAILSQAQNPYTQILGAEREPERQPVIREQTWWERLGGGIPRAWSQAALSGIQGLPGLAATAVGKGMDVQSSAQEAAMRAVLPESIETEVAERATSPQRRLAEMLSGYGERQRETEELRQWQLEQAARPLGPVPSGALKATAYAPEVLAGAVTAIPKAAVGATIRRQIPRLADDVMESPARSLSVVDLDPVGPAAREALRVVPDDAAEIASEAASGVVRSIKPLAKPDPDRAAAAIGAKEFQRSADTPIGKMLADDVVEVSMNPAKAAVMDAKYRLVSGTQYNSSFVAGVAEQADMARFPDKAVRQDMIGLLEGTGNPLRGADDTIGDVVARLRDKGVYEDAAAYVSQWRAEASKLIDELNSIRVGELGKDKLDPVANYVHHEWDLSREEARKLSEIVQTTSPVERPRLFDTMFEAMHGTGAKEMVEAGYLPTKGLRPKYDDLVQMVARTRNIYGRTLATKNFMADLSTIQKDMGGQFLVRGAAEATRAANLAGSKPFKPIESSFLKQLIPGSGEVYVHPEMHRILETAVVGPEHKWYDTTAAAFKNIHFLMSFFHRGALWESNIHSLGPIRGVLASAKGGLGIPGISHALARTRFGQPAGSSIAEDLFARGVPNRVARELDTGRPWVKVEDPRITSLVPGEGELYMDSLVGEQVNAALRANLPSDARSLYNYLAGARLSAYGMDPGRPFADTMLPLFDQAVDTAVKELDKAGLKPVGSVMNWLNNKKHWVDASLWDHLHHSSRIYAGNHLLDMALAAKRGEKGFRPLMKIAGLSKKKLQGMTDNDIGRAVVKYVNDEFGGQNWALHTGKVMGWLSRPDVQRNLRRVYISPDWNISSFRATWSPTSKDPIRRWLGFRHWTNAYFGVYNYANILNKAFSGHYMWENEPGKRGHIDTGTPGPARYIRIEKQEADAFRPFTNLEETKRLFPSKMRPELQAIFNQLAPKKPWEKRRGLFEEFMDAASPFAMDAVERGGVVGMTFPVSGGLRNARYATPLMVKALEVGDMERFNEIQRTLLDNGAPAYDTTLPDGTKVYGVLDAADRAWKNYEKILEEPR